MSDVLATADPAPARRRVSARTALLKRLADVVSLPASRVNAFERAVTADLLVEILREAEPSQRERVARRLAPLSEIPTALLRLLLKDEIAVAGVLLADHGGLNDCDLLDCIEGTGLDHHLGIAHRRPVSEIVVKALVALGQPAITEALLKNPAARFTHVVLEMVALAARDHAPLAPLLIRRPEMRPSHAYLLFWWADPAARRTILQRFAVSREILQDAASDVFAIAAEEGWRDGLTRKALQFIERRQRNRAALSRSPYESLEAAIADAADGLTHDKVEEIAYLSGVRPMTAAKIMADPGGEPLAILCKSTGLHKAALRALWRAAGRPETLGSGGAIHPHLAHVLEVFDMMAVDRAQTVLRYWNWALSSAISPELVGAAHESEGESVEQVTFLAAHASAAA
jgi:uncharacterized protein (DUF2336 family)